jgi:anti-anti-sigma factor
MDYRLPSFHEKRTASSEPAMEIIELNGQGDVVRLLAKGQIVQRTLTSSNLLGEGLARASYDRRVLLSLAEVTFVDSTGLGWLLKCNKLFRDAGGTLMIHSIPPVVLDVINVMRLSQVLKLFDDEESALASIQGANQ